MSNTDLNKYRVLVIGPRRGLLDELRARAIPFAVWQEKTAMPIPDAQPLLTAPLWNTTEKLKQTLRDKFGTAHFTHVIAGSDAAVYPAAVSRRALGARRSPTTTALRCRDKLEMKAYLSDFDIPMTDFMAESSASSADEAFARLGTPIVRKRRKSSGGRGLELLHTASDLEPRRDGRNILERFVDASEASIESFISNGEIRFVNTTRYLEKGHVNFVPAALDDAVEKAIISLNRRVIEALNISWGMTHLEVYLGSNGLLFGEIALRPPGGYIMNAIQHAYAFNPWKALLAIELGEDFEFPVSNTAYSSVELFHPGAGKVAAIHGYDWLKQHSATRELHLKIKPGDTISKRESAGQDVGYIVHTSDTASTRLELQNQLDRNFLIEMH